MSTSPQVERLQRRKKSFTLPEERMGSLCKLPTGRSYDFKFERKRHLAAQLFDHFGHDPLESVSYKIEGDGGAKFEGKTDDQGKLVHEDVPKQRYTLTLDLDGKPYPTRLAWVHDKNDPIEQRVRNVGVYQVAVKLFDRYGKAPVANVAYRAHGEGHRFDGKTDAEGMIVRKGLPVGAFAIVLSPEGPSGKTYLTKVPSIALDAEPLEQRVLGLRVVEKDDEANHLRVKLFDHFGTKPLAAIAYKAEGGGKSFEGTTDASGGFVHENVPEADFTVTVRDANSGLALTARVPYVRGDAHHEQRVRGFGVGSLNVQLFDARGVRPLAGMSYIVQTDGFSLAGRTDEHGRIGPKEAPAGVLTILIRLENGSFASTRVPTVELGGRALRQRVLGIC